MTPTSSPAILLQLLEAADAIVSPMLEQTEQVKTEARRWLDKLGNTKEEIATTLSDLGICGIPASTTQCPVARYISSSMPELAYARVGSSTLNLGLSDHFNIQLKLTQAVKDFIAEFDRANGWAWVDKFMLIDPDYHLPGDWA